MVINFVGIFNQPGYVGEISDETHLALELEEAGNTVNRVQRDVWKAYVDGEEIQKDWVLPIKADINIIAKWHHFTREDYINKLKEKSGESPVFYWVWDYMDDQGIPDWHLNMARAADLYLSGEGGLHGKYRALGIKHYYFQFDVCDRRVPVIHNGDTIRHKVAFFGSYLGQGNRIEYLKKINEVHPVDIYSWNYEEWKKLGFNAYPAVYGAEFNKEVAHSDIVLGFSVEANCWGYWSNRVGKTIRAGGFLLQQYAPGMEQFLHGYADFFSTPGEAIEKITFYLGNRTAKNKYLDNCRNTGWKFTSKEKIAQLLILCERYLKSDVSKWII